MPHSTDHYTEGEVQATRCPARLRPERQYRKSRLDAGSQRRMLYVDARAARLFGTGTVNSSLLVDSVQHRLVANR